MAITVAAQPQATWLERQHDFGVFKEADGKVSYPLRLVNTGNEPLLIVKVQAGCGCTAINYPEAPIAPGDTAAVTLTYNPSGRPGQFTKQALIFCNTEPRRTTLEITGNVIPTDVTLDKQYPIRAGSWRVSQGSIPFGELFSGKNKTLYLSAYNASTDTLLVSVTGSKPHIRPAVVPDTVPPARVTALTVHYMSKYAPLWGFNVDTLTLVSQALHQPSQAVAGTATVNVMAQVMEDSPISNAVMLPLPSPTAAKRLTLAASPREQKPRARSRFPTKGRNDSLSGACGLLTAKASPLASTSRRSSAARKRPSPLPSTLPK